MSKKSKMVFRELLDFESVFTINFMCMTSYFHVISGSAHGVGGVAENLVRANALKSENLLFTVIIHPSYINGKDRAISFFSSTYFWILEMQLPLTLIFHRSIRKHVAEKLTPCHYQLLTERRLYQGLHQRKYIQCEAQDCGPIIACEVIRLRSIILIVCCICWLVRICERQYFESRRCFSVLLIPDRVSTANHQLVMASKRAKRGKSKAASEPEVVFDQLRFLTPENE
ncbi:hypothetical protein CFP56_019398 [Quercus suber]|uniref:Uncharacterized protein n=1 Tax=Quercus suber TaxID=58331 RepID=A0AAW0KGW4_QUESU